MLLYIFARLQENLQNHFQVIERAQVYDWDHFFSKSRLNRVTVLVFCISSYDALYLCEVLSKYLKRFQTYRADT